MTKDQITTSDQRPNNILGSSKLQLKIIFNSQNLGFAAANNQGIKIAQGEYILLLNPDTVVKRWTLKKLVEYLKRNPGLAAVSPMLVNPDGSPQFEYYMRFPNFWQMVFYHNILLRPLGLKPPIRWLLFGEEQLPGAALLARGEIWRKTSGLDEDYPLFFEDVDWCYRVKEMQLGKLAVLKDVEIIHFGGGSWRIWRGKHPLEFYQRYFGSLLLFLKKHYPTWKRVLLKTGLVLSFLTNALVHLIVGRKDKAEVQINLISLIVKEKLK